MPDGDAVVARSTPRRTLRDVVATQDWHPPGTSPSPRAIPARSLRDDPAALRAAGAVAGPLRAGHARRGTRARPRASTGPSSSSARATTRRSTATRPSSRQTATPTGLAGYLRERGVRRRRVRTRDGFLRRLDGARRRGAAGSTPGGRGRMQGDRRGGLDGTGLARHGGGRSRADHERGDRGIGPGLPSALWGGTCQGWGWPRWPPSAEGRPTTRTPPLPQGERDASRSTPRSRRDRTRPRARSSR